MNHLDKLGIELNVDDIVAVSKNNSLVFGRVIRFTPKMVCLGLTDPAGRWSRQSEFKSYPVDIVKLDQQQALIYLLKGSNK